MNPQVNLKTRREFLRTTVLGGALTWTVPAFIARTFDALQLEAANAATQVATGKDSPILVVVQMAGGNDGLNTVVPYANDYYSRARPRLRLAPESLLKLNDELAFHPSLKGFRALYDEGQLCMIHGVGYPNPNRSHFRSTEIWQTASDSNQFERHGWLGRFFDSCCAGAEPTVGVNIGRQMPQSFASKHPKGISLDNPENYRLAAMDDGMDADDPALRQMNRPDDTGGAGANAGGSIAEVSGAARVEGGSVLDYVERTALDAQLSSDRIRDISRRVTNQATYPASSLANSLKLVSRLIAGGLATRVYYVSQGGYDTHTNQAGAHTRLLQDLGDGLKAFIDDLKAQGNFERVLVMTFSEFGRRVAENASGGTDHGAAAPMFVLAPRVRAGFVGSYPSLAPGDLVNGDLKFKIDFRSIYAGVLEGWLKAPSQAVLGRPFEPVKVI